MIAEMPSTSTAMGQLLGEGIGDSELHVSSSKVIDNLHVNATAPRLGEWFLPDCEPFVNEIVCESNVSPRPRATPAGWWLQHHLRVRRHDQRAASYAPTRASNWLSPPRRSRRGQCDGERITTQHHEREQGSHARFQCRSPAARRRSGRARLRFPPPRPWPPTLARSALRAAT